MSQHPAWRFCAWPSELKREGIVGINRRNGHFILPWNRRAFYPRVDEKHLTKGICQAAGIPVPQTYALIENNGDVTFRQSARIRHQARRGQRGPGHRGRRPARRPGVLHFQRPALHAGRSAYHISAILSGLYSLQGQIDLAIIEQRIVRHEAFAQISEGGTPDIRVVLYRCVPVMAMVRLPTRASRGKANLHQGAAGAGVDLCSGRTFGGVCLDRAIATHPDTGHSFCAAF